MEFARFGDYGELGEKMKAAIPLASGHGTHKD